MTHLYLKTSDAKASKCERNLPHVPHVPGSTFQSTNQIWGTSLKLM